MYLIIRHIISYTALSMKLWPSGLGRCLNCFVGSSVQRIHWFICTQYRKISIRAVTFCCKERKSAHYIPDFVCSVSSTTPSLPDQFHYFFVQTLLNSPQSTIPGQVHLDVFTQYQVHEFCHSAYQIMFPIQFLTSEQIADLLAAGLFWVLLVFKSSLSILVFDIY